MGDHNYIALYDKNTNQLVATGKETLIEVSIRLLNPDYNGEYRSEIVTREESEKLSKKMREPSKVLEGMVETQD